jgi:hypothetical protein
VNRSQLLAEHYLERRPPLERWSVIPVVSRPISINIKAGKIVIKAFIEECLDYVLEKLFSRIKRPNKFHYKLTHHLNINLHHPSAGIGNTGKRRAR